MSAISSHGNCAMPNLQNQCKESGSSEKPSPKIWVSHLISVLHQATTLIIFIMTTGDGGTARRRTENGATTVYR